MGDPPPSQVCLHQGGGDQQGEDTEPAINAAGGTPTGVILPQAHIPLTLQLLPQHQTSLPHALLAPHWGERTNH